MGELSRDDHPQPVIDFDPSDIFIGRDQQLDLFAIFLERWKRLMAAAPPRSDLPLASVPSPHHKIQGLVVLLYGRGGFGKTTLLKRYREMALAPDSNLTVGEIVDWEFDLGNYHGVFNPPPGQDIDAGDYFRIVCDQLAAKLGKRRDHFREYQDAASRVEAARKGMAKEIERLQQDDRYAWLRQATSKEAVALLRTFVPAVNLVPGSDLLAGAAEQGLEQAMKFSTDQTKHLYETLRERLGQQLDESLEPAVKLGVGLGRDLARFARDHPLLMCFDTYELIDEGDSLLRLVMATAGVRVGWVLAGRDNLWAGAEQRKRSPSRVYGYKEIVPPDRGLAIDFNVGGVGAFTGDDIRTYFALLGERSASQPLTITEEEAGRILDVTQGVPLAVKIAAALYLETSDLDLVIEQPDSQREIVEQMVQRYLQHARDDQSERARLYGLALLRRADQPQAIAAALGLTPEQATTRYEAELSRLHRRYSFIFTAKAQPSLHQEVRYFLRRWLLVNRRLPEVVAVNKGLKVAHEAVLKALEEHRHYTCFKERLRDDEWIGLYLDLVEQQCWLDPAEGVGYCLPFMLAAAIYRREANQDAATLGNFFAREVGHPYGDWWKWAVQSLIYSSSRDPSPGELTGLEELTKLASQRCPTFPAPLPDCRQELEAALWWRLGEAYGGRDDQKALKWYEKALSRLGEEVELREAAAKTCWDVAYQLYEEKKHAERLPFLNRAIELRPEYVYAYNSRGIAYKNLNEYQRAIEDYTRAIELDPKYARAYNNRGIAYKNLNEYQRAIEDYTQAIELDPKYAAAYNNQGNAYYFLQEYQRAIQDYTRAIELDPKYARAYNSRGTAYYGLNEHQRAIQDYTRAIELDPNDATAYYNRGTAYNKLNEHQCAIQDYTRAIELDPNDATAYYNRGNAYSDLNEHQRAIQDYTRAIELNPNDAAAYYNRAITELWLKDSSQAKVDYLHAYELDPTDVNAPWMAEWIGMNIQHPGRETTARLEEIATIDPQAYVAYICRGVAAGLRSRVKESLEEVEKAIALQPEEWDAYFWKGMICAYLGRNLLANEAIEKALELKLPPILLLPLYWLEHDRPAFFREYARPLLARYGVDR